MRKVASDEAKAARQVLMHCHLDEMRKCESPRFLPSMLFEDMSPVPEAVFELAFQLLWNRSLVVVWDVVRHVVWLRLS